MDHIRLRPGCILLLAVLLVAQAVAQDADKDSASNGEAEESNQSPDNLSADRSVTEAPTTEASFDTGSTIETSSFKYTSTQRSVTKALYQVNFQDGSPCIKMEVDASVRFRYKEISGEIRDLNKYIPLDATTSGECGDDASTLNIKWSSVVLIWNFAKTPGGEWWYVKPVQIEYNTRDDPFENASEKGEVRLINNTMLLSTPVGRSYYCYNDTIIELNSGGVDSVMVILTDLRLQPFMKNAKFGQAYECGGTRAFRDETAPIAVGSTLAVVVLLTVTGYGVYRYFKIKKVQYDTME